MFMWDTLVTITNSQHDLQTRYHSPLFSLFHIAQHPKEVTPFSIIKYLQEQRGGMARGGIEAL